ncbi:MAG: GIY-YIG nuclease family protein [Candidatus Falkowbacteria bacterium]
MYYVYLIQCKDKTIYTGITNNLERRFQEHIDKIGGHYTKTHSVEKILYYEKYSTRSDALKREAQIKGWRREKKLNLINNNLR